MFSSAFNLIDVLLLINIGTLVGGTVLTRHFPMHISITKEVITYSICSLASILLIVLYLQIFVYKYTAPFLANPVALSFHIVHFFLPLFSMWILCRVVLPSYKLGSFEVSYLLFSLFFTLYLVHVHTGHTLEECRCAVASLSDFPGNELGIHTTHEVLNVAHQASIVPVLRFLYLLRRFKNSQDGMEITFINKLLINAFVAFWLWMFFEAWLLRFNPFLGYWVVPFSSALHLGTNIILVVWIVTSVCKSRIDEAQMRVCRSHHMDGLAHQVALFDQYISENKPYLTPNLSLTRLADGVGVSRNTISRIINAHYKMSYVDYINQLRVEHAKLLLRHNVAMSIAEVMAESGFNSKSTFNHAFKKCTGITPTQFRDDYVVPLNTHLNT